MNRDRSAYRSPHSRQSARCSRRSRIERLAGTLGDITLEQMIFVEMVWTTDHGFPPSSPRSLRAARNRWTRTVDSFRPVIALTSRGVQSP